jgi:serine/threonine-protein kinase
MPLCPSCSTDIPESGVYCPRCSAPTPWGSDVTHLLHDTPSATTRRKTVTSSSWLTSTEAIDHGRFAPGSIFDERYRIIGRLGKGGMGEVYRADDLKLGQPVALKFLPEDVDRDPARLTQLHTEVRMARQVSHPNVCRVYDVGEYEGHTFLSMEYVDGEDLASLIRRIGRFPQDRAVELARQICAGLAAAHDRGVVHRDLKPANIMLDGSGRIRITDFGLAGAAGERLRAGTPAYMAPEQLAGHEVTPRSDIYSLGLVLYELFTGRRALEGRSLAEIIAKREQEGITEPSHLVRDLDPSIDRAIMRCIETDPARRPSSALAVAAALPGGDPLAAALAAGETPSPEMVAAAGTSSALRPVGALAGLAIALAMIMASIVLADRLQITSIVPLPKPPVLLVDRAKQILTSLGYDTGVDSAYGFLTANYLSYAGRRKDLGTRERFATGVPAALHFWYRSSPVVMIPTANGSNVTQDDPPFVISGMTTVVVDPEGRLVRFSAVPPQLNTDYSKDTPVDWKPLFDAAGLDMGAFKPTDPQWAPPAYADSRVAWIGPQPGVAGTEMRIEAAGYGGKPVYFYPVSAWTTPTRMPQTIDQRRQLQWRSVVLQIIVIGMLVAAALIARHNIRKGRGDRRGAAQLAGFVLAAALGVWVFDSKHVTDVGTELGRFFEQQPLWAVGLLWLLYLALEPYVRRFWPSTLVSWSRLMARQFKDPLVGRDILFGVALGATMHVLGLFADYAAVRLGYPTTPNVPDLRELLGTSLVIARALNQVFNAVVNALFAVFAMVLLKIIVRREGLVAPLAIVVSMLVAVRGIFDGGSAAINAAAGLGMVTIIVLTIQRLGLVAVMTLFLVNVLMNGAVVTLDPSKWFFADSLLIMAIPAVLACYGFYVSRGGEPLFGRAVLD